MKKTFELLVDNMCMYIVPEDLAQGSHLDY